MIIYQVIEWEKDKMLGSKDGSERVLGTYFNKQDAYKKYNEKVDHERYLEYRRNYDPVPSEYALDGNTYTYYKIVKYTLKDPNIIKESEMF